MKIFNNVLRVLTIVLAVVSLVLFFLPFGKVIFADGSELVRTGTEFAFGSSYNDANIGKSSDLLFCIILTALTVLFSGLSFKFKGSKWATIGFSLVDAVYMLVVACSNANKFLDTQGFTDAVTTKYVHFVPLFIAIALFLAFASATANLLISDKLAVEASGNQTLTIPKKVVKFLRDYKGEIKKIVWPGPRNVVKNTLIVLAMCIVLGLFIWGVDAGLGALIGLIYK